MILNQKQVIVRFPSWLKQPVYSFLFLAFWVGPGEVLADGVGQRRPDEARPVEEMIVEGSRGSATAPNVHSAREPSTTISSTGRASSGRLWPTPSARTSPGPTQRANTRNEKAGRSNHLENRMITGFRFKIVNFRTGRSGTYRRPPPHQSGNLSRQASSRGWPTMLSQCSLGSRQHWINEIRRRST